MTGQSELYERCIDEHVARTYAKYGIANLEGIADLPDDQLANLLNELSDVHFEPNSPASTRLS